MVTEEAFHEKELLPRFEKNRVQYNTRSKLVVTRWDTICDTIWYLSWCHTTADSPEPESYNPATFGKTSLGNIIGYTLKKGARVLKLRR